MNCIQENFNDNAYIAPAEKRIRHSLPLISKIAHHLCLGGLCFVASACHADDDAKYSDVVESKNTPILSGEEALSFAKSVYFPGYKNPVVKNSSGGFGIWRLESKQKSNKEKSYWLVRIYSSRVIPSYSCATAFDTNGNKLDDPVAYCGYRK